MSYMQPVISNFRVVKNHPYLRALADISVSGFVMRGIKLEEGQAGKLHLAFPGRKVQGSWQLICESNDDKAHQTLLDQLTSRYVGLSQAA